MARIFSIFALLGSILIFGQNDTIVLENMIVTDIRLEKNKTQYIQTLSDSVIQQNGALLTELLNYNTPLYFKENGNGMVSSPSFRGTTAQQTAVFWNGIKINSAFLGQADFNTISSLNYDEILVKPGGGSVTHGSGAIGGSVHLNHNLTLNQRFQANILAGFSDFNTYKSAFKIGESGEKFLVELGYNRNESDNDYKVEDFEYRNHNGQYWNHTLNANVAYKFNSNNRISFLTEAYQDQRHFSLTEPTSTKTKYQNQNLRSLLQYENRWSNLISNFRVAFLNERYRFYQNLERDFSSMGELSSLILKYDGTYKFNPKTDFTLLAEYTTGNGNGEGGGISKVKQSGYNFGGLFSHQIFEKLYYEIGARVEMNNDYQSPFLFSFGTAYNPFNFYTLKLNISKNFRAPTFNDLYWELGGNLDLNAENSLQYEMNNEFSIQQHAIGFNLYYNQIKDMIRWVPGPANYWVPMNEDEVISKGIEVFLDLNQSFGNHTFQLTNSFAYTHAKNPISGDHLSYVPRRKLNGTFSHTYKNFMWYVQGLFVDEIFTTSDESADFMLSSYNIFNVGMQFKFNKNPNFGIGIYCKNIFDKAYEAYPYRPMPPRNFGIQITANIN